MLGQRSGRIILGNPEAGNATVIRMLQQPKGGAGYCDSLDILLQWNSAPFTAGDAIPLSIQIKGAGLVIRAFLSRFEIPRPRPSSKSQLETLLSRGEFLRLKPCKHAFKWVPLLSSQKGAAGILEKSGTSFAISDLYQEQYERELDEFCQAQKQIQAERQKIFKASYPELHRQYPKFSKALAKVIDQSDSILPAASEEQIADQESELGFTLPAQVHEFFRLTSGIHISVGVDIGLSDMFELSLHDERYYVLGEFWKEADGDQLLLRPGEEIIWYYAHEQNKVKRLCKDMDELLEKKIAMYLNNA